MFKKCIIALSIVLVAACTSHKETRYDYFSSKQLDVDVSKLEKADATITNQINSQISSSSRGYTSATGHVCKEVVINSGLRTACFIDQSWYLYPTLQ